jgi:dihydropteroate synthase
LPKIQRQSPKPQPKKMGLNGGTRIMGILNVTPDSFSDGGAFFERSKAIGRALDMARDGADIIDVGGESTRPGAEDVSADEEIGRVIPVIEAMIGLIDIPISIDTRKAAVARRAIKAGAKIVNDVSGLKHDPEMSSVIAGNGAGLIIMHMRGSPRDMQAKAAYKDVVQDVISELRDSIEIAKRAGVDESAITIDPGIGFAKTAEQSMEILARLDEFRVLQRPICIGTSRKSFLEKWTQASAPEHRLAATLATCAIAVMNGASILRVHDVKAAKEVAAAVDSVIKLRAH